MEEKNPTEIKDLPEDIVFNILLRLSAETIHNLRYVFNLITSSCFHDSHFRASKHGLLLSKQRKEEIKSKKRKKQPLYNTNLIDTNNKEELITLREFTAASGDILATCNGLVLFGDEKCETELFVANPATKNLFKLPAHKTGSCLDHIFGMTYITSTGEYKVIHCFIDLVNRSTSTKNNYCEILTLGCDSWKRVDKFPVRLLLQWSSRKFTFINNVAHCLALEDGCESCLVSFDMVEEKFRTTIVPIRLSKIDELLEIEGFVALVSHKKSKKTIGCRFQIWLLKDYDKGNWVRLRKIGLGGRNENVSSVTTPQHGTRIIFLQYDGPSKYYYYIGYDVQLSQKRYLDFRQKIPSANVFPHCESLLSCSNLIADEPYTETCKRRKLL